MSVQREENGNITQNGDSDENTALFKKILLSNGITDPVKEVIVKDAGLQGEGFASQTKCITIEFENPNKQPLNLFAKMVTSNASHTQMLNELKAFEKEGRFLTEYVSAAEQLCKAKGYEGLVDMYPKCYYGDDRIVVLENLVLDKGYCLLNKAERQDFEAAQFAIKTIAKHHAISYAMIQEEGGPEKFFKRFPNLDLEGFSTPQFAIMMGPAFSNSLNSNIKILESNDVEGKAEALEFLNAFTDTPLLDQVISNLKYDDNELLVLGHGDYWNNNMMFLKDKETNRIIGHKAIDLQVTRYNSPALDLIYYMFTSVKIDVRIAHLQDLLKLYLSTLKKVASDLGHSINLTFDELYHLYRKKFTFGFWMAMMSMVGMEAMKEFDVSKVDIKDWSKVFDQLIQKWISKNPKVARNAAEELVKLTREHKQLSLS